ncbi:MAG: ammonium transporter, Amt family [Verrucomicrobiota bacterium]|jgi:Amt family ammonium transporter|nr:ammonium transporter, Amt family [Verrucomicrobiota bacterium]MEA3162742.1 ammonium transporter, Amt family [Verrucomicrobiota bacterium]
MLNCVTKMRSFVLAGTVMVLLSASGTASRAEDTNASPTPTPATATSPTPEAATSTAPAAASPTPAAGQTPSVEDRLASLEAYINNTDGSKALPGVPGPGHNGWMMTCSALVLFMTLPGLALFYGGLVRRKNVLSVLAQCFGITGLVAILWWAFGYSLVFGKSFNSPFYGGSEYFFLAGVTSAPNTDYAYWVSQNVYAMYQLMFAIITPALIVGAIAERMKYWTLMLFIAFWMFLVYFPMAHMVWGITGFMNGIWNANSTIKAIDFAGGTVVHMTSGWSALILCLMLGPRLGFKKEPMAPHSMVLCMVGTSMLWVGWYGFNAGSAVAADVISSNAFTTTTLATAVGAFTWAIMEKILRGKASVLGYCSGAVAGLVVITPACGFVNATGAVIIGVLAAVVPYIAISALKPALGYDDALDTFGVHATGGTLGALLTGILATKEVNGNLKDALLASLFSSQVKAVILTIVLSTVATFIIGLVLKLIMGLRASPDVETSGLDLAEHGEEGYIS